jgi:PrgI family protein
VRIVHRTYRWLDAPPRLFGFTIRQWIVLLAAVAIGYGCVKALHVPAKVALSVGVFAIGLPAALAYLSDGEGFAVGRLLRDAVVWAFTRRVFEPERRDP